MMNPVSRDFSELMAGHAVPSQDCLITGMGCRSHEIASGDLFAACRGIRHHGLEGLDKAVQRGAVAVAYETPDTELPDIPVPHALVPHLSHHLSEIAGRLYQHPSTRIPVIGITGTDGKTSVSHLLAQMMTELGQSCGVIGTLGAGPLDDLHPTGHTTPDAVLLQQELFAMVERGDSAVAVEVSSHALSQYRCEAVHFDTVVLTNLGQDHLDYHGSLKQYAAAKRRLFTDFKVKRCVINQDDAFGQELLSQMGETSAPVLRCSLTHCDADSHAGKIRLSSHGLEFDWGVGGHIYPIQIPGLYGRFNVMNVLLAATVLWGRGMQAEHIAEVCGRLKPIPGRLEPVISSRANAPKVFIDYAHTAEALEAAAQSLSQHFGGLAYCVFGCGGGRDKGKRPRMGAVAERLSRQVILTDDNPRGEDPGKIIEAIEAGVRDSSRLQVEHDRQRAITQAIHAAEVGDVVLIAGKGHETEQVGASGVRKFSDHAAVQQALESRQ